VKVTPTSVAVHEKVPEVAAVKKRGPAVTEARTAAANTPAANAGSNCITITCSVDDPPRHLLPPGAK
jgi:hypothetical protein